MAKKHKKFIAEENVNIWEKSFFRFLRRVKWNRKKQRAYTCINEKDRKKKSHPP